MTSHATHLAHRLSNQRPRSQSSSHYPLARKYVYYPEPLTQFSPETALSLATTQKAPKTLYPASTPQHDKQTPHGSKARSMVDTAKENTSPTGHCHSPLTRDTSSLSASAVFALLHAHPDASRSRAGRETSHAPPALVVQTHQPIGGCRGECRLSLLCRPHAPTQAAAAPAVRPAARRPLSSAAVAIPLRVPRRVPPPLVC